MNPLLANAIMSGLAVGGIYSLVGIGMVLIYKASKVVSLTQGGLLLMGGILGWTILGTGLPLWLGILATLLACALLGYLVDRLTLRPIIGQPLLAAVMVTLALAWLFNSVCVLTLGGEEVAFPAAFPTGSYKIGNVSLAQLNVWSFAAAMLLFAAFTLFFRYTKAGLAMRATAEDHEVAQSLGISVKGVFSQTWMLSAVTAGIGGILLGSIFAVGIGLSEMGWKVLAVVLVGGLDSIIGCIIAGPLIGILENLSGLYIDPLVGGGMKEIAPYVVMILILIFRPYGLFGLIRIERI